MNCKMRKIALFHPQSRPTDTDTKNTEYDFVCVFLPLLYDTMK